MSEFVLHLYISGKAASSRPARESVSRLTAVLPAQWTVTVVDVDAEPHLAEEARILATPTLSYEHPSRPRRIIGDLNDARKILGFLGIIPKDKIDGGD